MFLKELYQEFNSRFLSFFADFWNPTRIFLKYTSHNSCVIFKRISPIISQGCLQQFVKEQHMDFSCDSINHFIRNSSWKLPRFWTLICKIVFEILPWTPNPLILPEIPPGIFLNFPLGTIQGLDKMIETGKIVAFQKMVNLM